ncbi:MAG: ABC transporter permease, partial [Geminicoccaceae bacterium]|nr:ABC transporter permease [Geminicoccaceae bacterium]
ALFLGPVLIGVIGTLLPAFGYLPVLGGDSFSLQPWRDFLATPGLDGALRLTLVSGVGATLGALGLTVLIFAAGHGTTALRRARRGMTPLLAVPHLALAVGLAFLIAPSGWIARLLAWAVTGWTVPPDVATVQDPYGIALGFGLLIKELPFLVLITFAALGQIRADQQLQAARTMGYGPVIAWLKVALPQVYPLIRLPVYAVLAYSLSVVDMAIVLAPNTPPPLAPLVLRMFFDPDLAQAFPAAAGAVLQLLVVLGAIGAWRIGEVVIAALGRHLLADGRRGGSGRWPRATAWAALGGMFTLATASVGALFLWSFAGRWRFPDPWPMSVSTDLWARQSDLLVGPFSASVLVALGATALALALVVGCLEHESRRARRPTSRALLLVYLPLLVPQIGFLFGVQVLLVTIRLDGSWTGLIWTHLLFVLPYVFLALAEPYRSLDRRYERTALMLGRSPLVVWAKIRLPLLLRPLMVAAAIGFAVSIAQYLPTVFAGAGRIATLTTEALSLAAGGNRRIVGLFAFVLAVLPLLGFAVALAIPAWRFRDRRAMWAGA